MVKIKVLILLLFLAVGCMHVEHLQEPETITGEEFKALTDGFDTDTKTSLKSNLIVWSSGDQIAIFRGTAPADKYQVKEECSGLTMGSFEMIAKGQETQSSEFNTNIAIYPYQEGIGCTYVKGNDGTDDSYQITGLTFPQTQTYSPDSFSEESFLMAAITTNLEDHKLNFKNLCGIIKLQLRGTAKIKTIELCGNNNDKIAGDATVTLYHNGSNPQISLTSETSAIITLDCGEGVQLNEETATNFHITVPPTNFEKGFRIKAVDIEGSITEFNTSKANSVRRSYIHTMPARDLNETITTEMVFIEMGAINKVGQFAQNFYGKQYYRTPRYIEPEKDKITVKSSLNCMGRVYQYDKDFNFIKYIDYSSFNAEEEKSFELDSTCKYIRLLFKKDEQLSEFEIPEINVTNAAKTEIKNIKPQETNTQSLIIPINVTQEGVEDILPDYGVLLLPDTYSNINEPTRLIIYCHGAGAHYTNSSTEISGLDAEYFLSEGYAVMDMDGNPFNSGDAHGYTPTAAQAYLTAYNWITENYNIRTDGILLGGRSMGGGMCFELMQSQIPVIAACPVVPVCNTLWWWNYMNASRREFCADKMGFQGVEPTWTNSKKMSNEEYEYLYSNFDILKAYSPFWRGIKNLPAKDELFSFGKLSASTEYDEAEYNYFSNLEFYTKAPVKMISCYEDKTVPYRRNAEIMYNMIRNSGQICELRMYHTDAASPHKFELQDSQAYTQVTTKYGKTMQAPFVYIEMMKFWRRFE